LLSSNIATVDGSRTRGSPRPAFGSLPFPPKSPAGRAWPLGGQHGLFFGPGAAIRHGFAVPLGIPALEKRLRRLICFPWFSTSRSPSPEIIMPLIGTRKNWTTS
jgi:hypothetical protein